MICQGLKVIDCGSFIAAPAAATLLGDFGADVIKIEPPSGDSFRRYPPLDPDLPTVAQLEERAQRAESAGLAVKGVTKSGGASASAGIERSGLK